MLCQFGKPLYVIVRKLPNCFVAKCSGYFKSLYMVDRFMNVFKQMEDFIHKTQKYAFTDSFSNLIIITNSFGKLAIWQTSFRKNQHIVQLTNHMEHASPNIQISYRNKCEYFKLLEQPRYTNVSSRYTYFSEGARLF